MINFQSFQITQETCAHRTEISTDKVNAHDRCTVFYWGLVLIKCASKGVVSTFSYHLSSTYYTSSKFAPTSLFPSASARVRPPLSLNRYAKVYGRVAPQPSNEANKMKTTYPAFDNLSSNHRTSGDASIILPHRLQQSTPTSRLWQSFFRHQQWVISTIYFTIYCYYLLPLS